MFFQRVLFTLNVVLEILFVANDFPSSIVYGHALPFLASLPHDIYVLVWGGVLKIWFERTKPIEDCCHFDREKVVFGKWILAFSLFAVVFNNQLTCLSRLSMVHVLMIFVKDLSHDTYALT